jgi:hypothetical protein
MVVFMHGRCSALALIDESRLTGAILVISLDTRTIDDQYGHYLPEDKWYHAVLLL